MSKSIQRASPSVSKRNVRRSSQTFLPSGASQALRVAITAGLSAGDLRELQMFDRAGPRLLGPEVDAARRRRA